MSAENPTTFEDLLDYPATIDKLTDAELEKILMPYFPSTRPTGEVASAVQTVVTKMTSKINILDIERLAEEARARGVKGLT